MRCDSYATEAALSAAAGVGGRAPALQSAAIGIHDQPFRFVGGGFLILSGKKCNGQYMRESSVTETIASRLQQRDLLCMPDSR